MTLTDRIRLSLLPVAALTLAACAPVEVVEEPPPPPTAEEIEAERRDAAGRNALRLGVAHFEIGNYSEAESTLTSPAVWEAPPAVRAQALKTLAFTYCVSDRPVQCRRAFERALATDPDFDLAPGEQGHPLWGPSFQAARDRLAALDEPEGPRDDA